MKVSEIDSKRMTIRVNAGKGAKDRYTLLSETALTILREYVRAFKPKEWLFAGEEHNDHLSERAAQQILKDAKKKAGINKPATFHTLRHSFADTPLIPVRRAHGNVYAIARRRDFVYNIAQKNDGGDAQ